MVKVTYLEHSGFFLELDSCCLLFDYWKGDIPDVAKPYYVFASHAHEDHFNPVIFDLLSRDIPTHLILSSDIKAIRHACVHLMNPQETLEIEGLMICTLTSTDEGVAFLVHVDGRYIYHAGDLHWWHWDEENTDEENREAKEAYLAQLVSLKDIPIDLAFVVLDPRLDEQSAWGMDAFMANVTAQHIFPMHLWGDYDAIERYKHSLTNTDDKGKVIALHHPQEEFIV